MHKRMLLWCCACMMFPMFADGLHRTQVACDGLPRPEGATCVAPSAGSASADAPASARVATAAAIADASTIAAGAALDTCTGVSGNWVKGIFCA